MFYVRVSDFAFLVFIDTAHTCVARATTLAEAVKLQARVQREPRATDLAVSCPRPRSILGSGIARPLFGEVSERFIVPALDAGDVTGVSLYRMAPSNVRGFESRPHRRLAPQVRYWVLHLYRQVGRPAED